MMLVLVMRLGLASLAARRTERLCGNVARRSRTWDVRASVVSTLCAYTSSPLVATLRTISKSPAKSPVSASTSIWGALLLIFMIVSAKCAAPPSAKSSRSTDVRTTYPNPHRLSASAVFSGSWGSNAAGLLLVFTEQNRQPRVHVSPINMIVAVAALLLDPPQQSLMLGHRASSHTVCKPRPLKSCLIFL